MVTTDRKVTEKAAPERIAGAPGRAAAGIPSGQRLAALIGNRAMARLAADTAVGRGSPPAGRSLQRWSWPWEDESSYQGGGGTSGGGGATGSWDPPGTEPNASYPPAPEPNASYPPAPEPNASYPPAEEPNASYPPPTMSCAPCPPNPPPEIDRVPPSDPHYPCPGDHWHYREYNQNPTTCKCFLSGRLFGGCCGSAGAPC